MLSSNHDLRDNFADQMNVNPFDCGIRIICRENDEPKQAIFTLPDGHSYLMTRTSTTENQNNWSGVPI